MPIFDNELIDNVSDRTPEKRNIDLRSIDIPEVNTHPVVNLGGFENYGQPPAKRGLTVDEISEMSRHAKPFTGFAAPFESVPQSELIANKRYPMYERGTDLENVYGLQQSAMSQLGNGFAKLGISALGSFGQSFFTLPDTVAALRSLDASKLSGDMDGGEAKIDDWQKNMEDRFPNFMTRKEKEHPYLAAIPGFAGSANFWGDKIIKNIGFTAGTIAGSLVQDAAIAALTGGIGEIPLIGAQIGKAALWMNKIFAGTNKLDEVLNLAKGLGKTEQQLLRIEKLGQIAAATRLTKSAQYAYSLYGASRTEAAIEARDGYRQVKEELTRHYKETHYGEEPTANDLVEIENYATNAMNVRFGTNMALLTISNAIQFDNLLKTFNLGSKEIGSSLGKIGLKEGSLDEFEKKAAKTLSGRVWEFAKPKLKNVITEGVYEEGGQYAAERGTYDYYTRKYKNLKNSDNRDSWNWLNESIKSTNTGLAEQFGSQEGIENMLVGGLSALITGGITNRIEKIRKIDEDSKLKSTINILNRWGLTDILENQYDSTLKSVGIAKEMRNALKSGDIFQFKNLKQDLFFNMIKSRANNGLHETTIEQLNMLRDLDKDQFEKMFGLNLNKTNKKTVNAYVDAMIEQANEINSTIESIDSTFTNPFTYVVDPKNPEQEKQSENYTTFENWKTDLAYYSTQRKDASNRLTSIQAALNKINPLLNNDTLGGLHDAESLTELSKSYEEQANRLNDTITEYTSIADKKRIREQVKALRTNSEKINLALNNNILDLKTFHSLLNFELNNQDNTKDDVVGFEDADKLFTYGADIKLLNQRKKQASDTVEYLSKEEGFNNYFKQQENIANDEVPMEELLKGTAQPTFVNDEKVKEQLEVDREYEIRTTKKASVKKIADDRYQVTGPDGTISFHKTRKDALLEASDLTAENTNLARVKVLAINDDGTVKVEDINGDILNINPKRLRGYKRLETDQEKLLKNKEDITREQDEIEHDSGTIATANPEVIDVEEERKKEGKKLSADQLFISSTSESENEEYYTDGKNAPANVPAHVKNSREFLNNAHTFSNRGQLRSILITPNQVRGLKLDGLVQMSYRKDASTRVEDIPDAMDVNNGLVLQVFVEQKSDGLYYVNKDGKTLGKVGEPLGDNLKDIIFQTMRTTSLTYKNGSPRYRTEQKAEAEAYSRSWAKYREALFANDDTTFPVFQFSISRGIAKEKRDENNLRATNHVGGILIDEDLISKQEGLVVIPTGGTITNAKGEILKWASGIPTLKYGDTLEYLNNRIFNSREVAGIYEVIRQLADNVLEQSRLGQPVTLKGPLSNFLQHVLYWRSKADTYGPNQIGIDVNSMSLKLGRNSFPLDKIADNEAAIKEALSKAYNNVNGNTLSKYFSRPFTEFYIDKDGNFTSSQWKNYQTYLLSKFYPSGKARPASDTPLTTGISPKTAETPYVFENKYSTLQGIDLPIEIITPADEAKTKGVATVGEYIVDNETPNTFNGFKAGPVEFKAIEDADGNFNVEVDRNETTAKVAKDEAGLKQIMDALKAINKFDASLPAGQEETYVTDFMAIQIAATLKQLKQQEAAPEQAPKPAETAPSVNAREEEIGKKLDALTEQFIAQGKTQKEAEALAIQSITEEERQVLRDAYNAERKDKEEVSDVEAKKAALESKPVNQSDIVTVYHHTSVTPKDFNFGNFQKGDKQISQFGDGLNASSTTTPFFVKRYGEPIQGEIKDSDFIVIDANKSEKELYEYLVSKGYKFDSPAKEYDGTEKANDNPAVIILFNDFQKSNPQVKGVKVINHIIGTEKVDPFYVIYDAKSFYGPGSLSKSQTQTPPNEFPSGEFRRVGVNDIDRMSESDFEIFKEWAKENLPLIPWEELEHMITINPNEKAWGVFVDGVAKFVKGGLRGTEYHEIMEAVWAGMLTPEQRQAILDEFKNRKGFFVDRETGNKIAFIEATDQEAKERIMDDFSDFRLGKLPARTLGEFVRRLFNRILNFFKTIGRKPSLKQELFEAINAGKFKERALAPEAITSTPEYSRVANLTSEQAQSITQDMMARAAALLFRAGDKEMLFNPERLSGREMFDRIEQSYIKDNRRQIITDETWEQLKEKVKTSLSVAGVKFNEEEFEEVKDINSEDANKNDYTTNTFQDTKKNATAALKFSLSTVIERVPTNQENALTLELPIPNYSDIQLEGYPIKNLKLLPFNRVFATLLDKLSNTSDVKLFIKKMLNLAEEDANYVSVFQRMGGKDKVVPFSEFKYSDWRYFIQFMQTFARQKPEAYIQYKSIDSVHTGAANLHTAASQTQKEWITNIETLAKGDGTIVKWDNVEKVFTVDKDALKAMPIRQPGQMIAMLNAIGVNFDIDTYNKLKTYQKAGKNGFADQVRSIYAHLGDNNELMSISNKTLDINGPLAALAEMYNKVNNPSQESTYFGVEGERIGAFSENNVPSVFKNEFNEADTLADLKQVRTELNDVFSTNSQVLKPGGLFYDEDGVKRKDLEVSYIQGEKDEDNDKGTTTSKLTLSDRFTLEINQNLKGNYYILIPGDSATEGMMNIGNNVTYEDVRDGKAWKQVSSIFKGYLFDEVNLALDFKNREELKNIGGKEKQLRFFNDILFDNERDEINQMLEDNRSLADITDYINANIPNINSAIKYFIENTINGTRTQLQNSNKINVSGEGTYSYLDLDANFAKEQGLNKNNLSNKSVDDIMTFANINYVIANIEYHKILFGDPYQFAIKEDGSLEAIKRFKSFFSPRRTTFDSPELNTFLNNEINTVDGIKLDEYVYNAETNTWTGDLGGHGFKDHTNTVTLKDNIIAGSLANLNKVFGKTNETDGVSWLRDTTYREIKIKNGQWDIQGPEEKWFQWEMAFTRQNLPGYKYSNPKLEAHDVALMQTDRPAHTIEVLKPIVTGNKLGKNHFDIILDKFSQMPVFYSMVKGTTLEKFYIQMMKQDIGYAIVQSGRKVGTQETHSIYDGEGKFNEQPFSENTIVQVPWKTYGIQVETTTSGIKSQTRGSQITKMASMDLFDNGEPIGETQERRDYIKKEYLRNKQLLDTMHENAYKELLISLGIEDLGGSFVMKDGKSISETLMNELLRRKASENTVDTLELTKENQFRIPFEASPSYSQIRSVIYSMIDKSIGSPSMTGGAHVQAPVTMLESATKGRSIVMKNDKGMWEKITREKYATLSDKEKAGVMLTDDSLKFYTKDEPWCEIYLPYWFKDRFKGKFKTDKELLNYLNKTEEGRSILKGIGFRIPTQSLSSTEVFKVKGFLPKYMGATVIVPSEITTKAGSDFDIDKLNMYLKSIYIDRSGNIRLVRLQGTEESTKEFYGKVFDDTLGVKQMKKADLIEALDIIIYGLEDPKGLINVYGDYIKSKEEQYDSPYEFRDLIEKDLEKLTDENLQAELRLAYVKDMYKKALENEYYDSLEKLITLPENFERLISPVDDSGLKDIATELNGLEGKDDNKIKNRLLDRNYMTNQRGNFLRGKRWVGIAAVNITNLSLKQKSQVYIDEDRFKLVPFDDRKYLGDGKIILDHNKTIVNGKERISLSGTKTAVANSKGEFEYISTRMSGYATGAVDITNNDFITRIVKSDLIIGTFMFLENVGVGEQGIFFLNQPIITEYLKMLDSKNVKSLFYDNNIDAVRELFPVNYDEVNDVENAVINIDGLKDNISKYATTGLNSKDNYEQQLILDEFLKYAKMAEFNFEFTQSTNYDTSKFSSGDILARKQWSTQKANSSNIISSAEKVLDNSHIGLQAKLYADFMSAMGAVFKLEEDSLRIITESVLKIYGKNKYLSQDNFNKISNKVKMSFLDYIIQTKTGLNNRIEELLVNPKTAVVNRLEKAKQDYPNIQILKELQVVQSPRIGGAKSIQLRVNDKTPESENLNQDMMRELRDYNEETKALYDDLISVAILQGSYQSAISFKNIIPIEDYSKIITPVVSSISSTESLKAFSQGFFERNNFNDTVIVPRIKSVKLKIGSEELVDAPDGSIMVINTYYAIENFPSIKSLGINSIDRQVLLLTERNNPKVLNSNFITMPRVLKLKSGERVDMVTGKTITSVDYAIRLKKGDLSLNDVFGYKRVLLPTGEPLRVYDYNSNLQSVYKMVNLYGDGNRASEYRTDLEPSVINNGTIKVNQELNDLDILANFPDYYVEQSLSLPAETPETYGSFGTDKEAFDAYRKGFLPALRELYAKRKEEEKEDGSSWENLANLLNRQSDLENKEKLTNNESNELIDIYKKLKDEFGLEVTPEETIEETIELTPEETLQLEIADVTRRIAELEQLQEDLDENNLETVVVNNLPKITPVSAIKETGAKVGTKLDISPSLLSGNGVTVDKAAHDIWENNFGIDSNTTTEDIRNIIIDILSSGSKANYKSQLATSGEMARLKEELRDLKTDLSELEKGKSKIKTPKPIPGQLDLFAEEDESWKDEDNNDTCVPF